MLWSPYWPRLRGPRWGRFRRRGAQERNRQRVRPPPTSTRTPTARRASRRCGEP